MSTTPTNDATTATGPSDSHARDGKSVRRLQHVVAHVAEGHLEASVSYDDFLVFGQEFDALRHTHGKSGWVYVAVAHGQSVVEALKGDRR